MKIVAFVPAKGSSTRVPNKNLRVLDGEYLFKRKLKQLLLCRGIHDVFLDTESSALADLSQDIPIRRLVRPDQMASNATDGHELFAFECAQVPDADIYIQALCTAPFVDESTITRALQALLDNPGADSLVAVRRTKQYRWDDGVPAYGTGRIPNSADLPPTVVEAMSLYMVRRQPEDPPPTKRFGNSPIFFDLSPEEEVDVNMPEDLDFAEVICAGHRAQVNSQLFALRPHLTSSVLSDVCKELGIPAVLPSTIRRITGGKIIGRAKTLELAALSMSQGFRKSEEWKGIYKALDSYAFVRPGDIIVVSTEVPGKAYFGDLNANLAVRAGAAGAIIDGYTRDSAGVEALGFSVYAHSSYCDDIKFEGTLANMNTPVTIGDVTIRNNDLVFADPDGVIVIPQERWAQVMKMAWEALANEARIRLYAAGGQDIEFILRECGAF